MATTNTMIKKEGETMAAAANPNVRFKIQLLIDKWSNKVLFAEARKDFVDFLFNLLALPVATVIKLANNNAMAGSLANLYRSLETLDEAYIQPNRNRDSLLELGVPMAGSDHQLPLLGAKGEARKVYMCEDCEIEVADDPTTPCPHCDYNMEYEIPFVAPAAAAAAKSNDEGGFVKGVVSYMVMDDLTVKPMSTISSITLLNHLNVKDVGALEERVVDLGIDEGLKLLKCSMQSKSVLTDVFLSNRKA